MKNLKSNKLRLSAVLTLAVTLLCCLTLAFTGIFGGFAKAQTSAELNDSNRKRINEIYNTSTDKFFDVNVLDFFTSIAGADNGNYKALEKYVDSVSNKALTSTNIRAVNGGKNLTVMLGGLEWNVVYVSKTKDDSTVIATLYLAETTDTSRWSDGWINTSGNVAMDKLSSIYGSSYIRAVTLNAGSYYSTVKADAGITPSDTKTDSNGTYNIYTDITSDDQLEVVKAVKNASNKYARFTMPEVAHSLTDYIVTPRNVAWQEIQRWNGPYHIGNEAWGDVGSTGWFPNVGGQGNNAHDAYNPTKFQYSDWADDYVWLPSISEVVNGTSTATNAGAGDNTTYGIWRLDAPQRHSTIDSYSRSQYTNDTTGAYVVTGSDGSTDIGYTVDNPYLVRPALHLDLKAVASNCSSGLLLSEDLYNEVKQDLDKDALNNLYSQIAGKENASISDVKKLLTADNGYQYSAEDIRTDNLITGGNDIYVYFGGLRWTVTYVSKSKTGNLVATLWLESSYIDGTNQTSVFTNWLTSDSEFKSNYVSSIYGTSQVRSYLNGTPYYSNSSGTLNNSGAQSEYWKNFNSAYGKFIIEPLYMSWQETEILTATDGSTRGDANNAWGSTVLDDGNIISRASQKLGYSAWATDKLWLPSDAEAGGTYSGLTYNSLWGLTSSQRQNGTSTSGGDDAYSTWFRSSGHGYGAMALYGNGTGFYSRATNIAKSVRPAIHLNISGENTDLWNEECGVVNDFALDALMENLTSAASSKATITSSYKDLDNLLSAAGNTLSAKDIRDNNGGSDINVKFGGMHWDMTYLSRTRNGDIIATLWLDNSNEVSQFSPRMETLNSTAPKTKYPADMYGSSLLRAYLNGTDYSADGSTLTSGKSVQNSNWKNFINAYKHYIATPSQVALQETENAFSSGLSDSSTSWKNNAPNECYGKPSEGSYYSGMDFSDRDTYGDWQYDYLWVPSVSEIGFYYSNNEYGGYWNTGASIRRNSATYWTRSANYYYADAIHCLGASGMYETYNYKSNASYAVRPAIHLNLARIKDLLTPEISDNAATEDGGNNKLVYNGQAQEVINNILPDLTRVDYTVQFESFANQTSVYYPNNIADGGISVEGGKMFATRAGKYTVTFTLANAATTSGTSNYVINKNPVTGWNDGDVWAGIDDDIKTQQNERVSTVVIYFEIAPITLQVEWSGDLTSVYDGNQHAVIATPKGDIVDGETVELALMYYKENSSTPLGITEKPTAAGNYTVKANLSDPNYILEFADADGFDTFGYTATCPMTIEKAKIEAVWTEAAEFVYNGTVNGATLTELTGLCGEEAENAALLSAAQGAVVYDKTPLHVGGYVASLSLEGLDGFENYELSETTAQFAFKITPAEVTANYVSADGTFEREFNGKKLIVTADGFTALAAGDDESIFVIKYKLDSAADVPENWSLVAPVFGEYVAKAFDNAHGDYTVTNSQTVNISQRQINLIWSGDEKSVVTTLNGAELITWLYDGAAHAPTAAVNADDLQGVVGLDGVTPVTDLKLEVTTAGQQNASVSALRTTVRLSADEEINKYFVLAGAVAGGNAACNYRIVKLDITKVQWYPYGGYGNSAMLEDGAKFQRIEVFGAYGPEVEAYGVGTLEGNDGKQITSVIKLSVTYNANFANEYWTVGDYIAAANISVGTNNAAFASGLDNALDFTVTEQKIEVKEVTVIWGILVDGAFVELTDGLVMPFNGSAPALVAKADGATGANLPINAESLVANAGKHTAYIDLKNSSTVVYKNFECAYEITPLKVKLVWAKNQNPDLKDKYEWFYTGSDIALSAAIDTSYLPDGFTAAEYAEILADIATAGLSNIKINSAKNAGKHTAVAAMSGNFEIVDGSDTLEFTILKYRLNVDDVKWFSKAVDGAGVDDDSMKYDADMKKYFTWANDGTAHAPYAELSVTVGGESLKIKLIVNGATGVTGTHYATALLDSSVAFNNNFILGSFKDGEFIPCGAECKFVIVQFEVGDIYWVTGANDGADVSLNGTDVLNFTFNGLEQCPRAYYLNADGEKVWLEVWGAMTDAGSYVAHVVDNYAFKNEGSDKCAFVIKPQELEVRWQYDETAGDKITYNGLAQAPSVKLFDGDGKEITSLADGNGYNILKFTEAGEHVAKITFTNGNYTYKSGTEEKAFTIHKYQISVTFTPNADATYVWTYNAGEQGPAVKDTAVHLTEGGAGIIFGENSAHKIIVTGRESAVGVYTAVATLDGSVADNANFELLNAEKEYEIAAHKIIIIWKDDGADGNFIWTYSGKTVCPTATYTDWTGATQQATVIGGNSSAGTYTASVVLPANCEFMYSTGNYSGSHGFTIKRATVTEIEWYTDDTYTTKIGGAVVSYTFDGKMHLPAAKIKDTGEELIVTGARRNAGTGYIATAALSDSGNYVLDENNANKTVKFNIDPMQVFIKWIGNADAESAADEFVWTYTGGFICPTAVLTFMNGDGELQIVEEDGKAVYVTVSGGAVSAGDEYAAVAVDNLTNYDFATARQPFEIKAKLLDGFMWSADGATVDDSEVVGGGFVKYVYTYNGKVQRPLATLKDNVDGIKFGYDIYGYDGTNVGNFAESADAGLYLLTVYPTDGNYALPEGAATVVVEIVKRVAEVNWSAISAEGETKAPEAWYFDADNQAVKLEVTVVADGKETGADGKTVLKFIASVNPDNVNYNFTGEKSKAFTMVVTSTGDVTWDFENNKWEQVTEGTVTPSGQQLVFEVKKSFSNRFDEE